MKLIRSSLIPKISERVAEIYQWLDLQISDFSHLTSRCTACGKCCNFDEFDHHLFVTTPELIYLADNLAKKKMKSMLTSRCPYNINDRCTIYDYRFAGCRIFCCKADAEFQSQLSEAAVSKFKSLCEEFELPYRYTNLQAALSNFNR